MPKIKIDISEKKIVKLDFYEKYLLSNKENNWEYLKLGYDYKLSCDMNRPCARHIFVCANCQAETDKEWAEFEAKQEALQNQNHDVKKRKHDTIALWYGVSPPRDKKDKKDNFDEDRKFIKKWEKFISANCIEKAIYNFEWKYDKGGPYGIHVHSLIYANNLTKVKQHIKRQKDKMFNLNKKQLREIKCEDIIKDKIAYFQGETFSEDKNLEKSRDKSQRKIYNLEDPAKWGFWDIV